MVFFFPTVRSGQKWALTFFFKCESSSERNNFVRMNCTNITPTLCKTVMIFLNFVIFLNIFFGKNNMLYLPFKKIPVVNEIAWDSRLFRERTSLLMQAKPLLAHSCVEPIVADHCPGCK